MPCAVASAESIRRSHLEQYGGSHTRPPSVLDWTHDYKDGISTSAEVSRMGNISVNSRCKKQEDKVKSRSEGILVRECPRHHVALPSDDPGEVSDDTRIIRN
jgi:hypothetical protein